MSPWPHAVIRLCLCLAVTGCGNKGGAPPPRVDTLSVEREQLLMVYQLPLGLPVEDVKLRFPSMGELRHTSGPGQAPAAVAHGRMNVMDGREATVEMKFENGRLAGYSFLVTGDSLAGTTAYERLQGFYTMQFGNYHQELHEDGDRRTLRSYWTSEAFAVVVVLRDSSGTRSLRWGFEQLPPASPGDPEPAASRFLPDSPLAIMEE